MRNQVVDVELVSAVADLIRAFMSACSIRGDSSVTKTLSLVQVAVSTILEAVAQIHLQGIDNLLVKSLLEKLIPAICALSSHSDKDVRVLLAVSLRQLGPTVIRLSIGDMLNENVLQDTVNQFDGLFDSNLLE